MAIKLRGNSTPLGEVALVLLLFLAFLAPLAVLINLAGYRGQVLSGRYEVDRYV